MQEKIHSRDQKFQEDGFLIFMQKAKLSCIVPFPGNEEVIRRLRCKPCQKVHHELPDIMIPYKRHEAKVIEAAMK